MSLEAKVWRIVENRPQPLKSSQLNYEDRLEDWLCDDINLLNSELLIVGRQVRLRSGGILDLLAIDEEANLVIVELKRDKTPREIVAQILDYASCIQDFGLEEIERHTQDLLKTDFETTFESRFGHAIPDSVNARHRMYIVATELDSATQRIVEYLSRTHGVDINAATFSYFNTDEGEFVACSMLLDEDELERRVEAKSPKRQPVATEQELRQVAVEKRVADLWDIAVDGFSEFAKKARSQSTLSFNTTLDEGNRAVLSIFPHESNKESGLAVTVVFDHFARGFGIEEDRIKELCGVPNGSKFQGSWSTPDNCYYLREKKLRSLLLLLAESSG